MSILGVIQNVLGIHPNPVVAVIPSDEDRDHFSERKLARQQDELLAAYNQSVHFRKELAATALRIVAGDR